MKTEELYGKFYANNPKNFKFLSGEIILIKELFAHVKSIADRNGVTKVYDLMPQISTNAKQIKHSYFLSKLLATFERNAEHKKGGYRYDSDLQHFSMLLRMISGPLAYQTLQSNLEGALPPLPSINRYIRASHFHITKGILRCAII